MEVSCGEYGDVIPKLVIAVKNGRCKKFQNKKLNLDSSSAFTNSVSSDSKMSCNLLIDDQGYEKNFKNKPNSKVLEVKCIEEECTKSRHYEKIQDIHRQVLYFMLPWSTCAFHNFQINYFRIHTSLKIILSLQAALLSFGCCSWGPLCPSWGMLLVHCKLYFGDLVSMYCRHCRHSPGYAWCPIWSLGYSSACYTLALEMNRARHTTMQAVCSFACFS